MRSTRWSRTSYWRRRARSAERSTVTMVATRTGRSSSVTLACDASCSSARGMLRESSPSPVSTTMGTSDHGGCSSSTASSIAESRVCNASSATSTAPTALAKQRAERRHVGAGGRGEARLLEHAHRDRGVAPGRREERDQLGRFAIAT